MCVFLPQALERIPALLMTSLRQNLESGETGLVLAALEALAVLPDIAWEFVEMMPAVLGYRHDASLAVHTAACACYEAFFQANPGAFRRHTPEKTLCLVFWRRFLDRFLEDVST